MIGVSGKYKADYSDGCSESVTNKSAFLCFCANIGYLTSDSELDVTNNLGNIVSKTGIGTYNYYSNKTYTVREAQNISNHLGTVEQELSYDAWGNYRNPDNWQAYSGATPTFLIDRGYTGHEHLSSFDLINMNGRIYDPLISRFLSPDPYIQAPGFSQNLNRYSYCLNNPLKYTDPSGEFITSLFLGPAGVFIDAALWSGTINLVSNWNKIDNFGEGLAVFGAGAAQGTLTVVNPALGSIVGGALTSATNSAVDQMRSWDDFGGLDWGKVGTEALTGAVTGAVSYGTGEILKKTNLPNIILDGVGVEKFEARNIFGNGIIGTIGGTTTGLADGVLRGVFYDEWDKVWERTWKGGAYGGTGGLVYGYVNQLGFELYKRTGDRRYFNEGGKTGKGMQDGVNASKQISEGNGAGGANGVSGSGINGIPGDVDGNSVYVVAHKNGLVTVSWNVQSSPYGAMPTVSNYYYYNPSLYRMINGLSLFRVR